jgi:hypothetical protein
MTVAAATVALGALLVASGVIRTPDAGTFLADATSSIGGWMYVVVAALAFLETAAFVGLLVPGEMAIVVGGVAAADDGDLSHLRDGPGAQGWIRGPVRQRRRRRAFAKRASHRHPAAGTRWGGSDHGARGVTELFRDWASPLAGAAQEVIFWYFNEVPKLTDAVGVAEAEKLAASAAAAQ